MKRSIRFGRYSMKCENFEYMSVYFNFIGFFCVNLRSIKNKESYVNDRMYKTDESAILKNT